MATNNNYVQRTNANRAQQTQTSITYAQQWDQEAARYEKKVEELTLTEKVILEIAADYYNFLAKKGMPVCNVFPHKMEDYDMALAWIVQAGNNKDLAQKMFKYIPGMDNMTTIYPICYNLGDHTGYGFEPLHDPYLKKDIPNDNWFEPVLTVFLWAYANSKNITKVAVKKIGNIKKTGTIHIRTEDIQVYIAYDKKSESAFKHIYIYKFKPNRKKQ